MNTLSLTPTLQESTLLIGPIATVSSERVELYRRMAHPTCVAGVHVSVTGFAVDGSAAMMFLADAVIRRASSGPIVLACYRFTTDEDFPNPAPSVTVTTDAATNSWIVRATGRANTPMRWVVQINYVMRRA